METLIWQHFSYRAIIPTAPVTCTLALTWPPVLRKRLCMSELNSPERSLGRLSIRERPGPANPYLRLFLHRSLRFACSRPVIADLTFASSHGLLCDTRPLLVRANRPDCQDWQGIIPQLGNYNEIKRFSCCTGYLQEDVLISLSGVSYLHFKHLKVSLSWNKVSLLAEEAKLRKRK